MDTVTLDLDSLRGALEPLTERAQPTEECPEAKTLWDAAQGDLGPGETRKVVDHLTTCLVCAEAWEVADDMFASRDGTATVERPAPPVSSSQNYRWWSSAAAAMIVLVTGALWQPWQDWSSGYRGTDADEIRSLVPMNGPLSRTDCVLRWEGPQEGLTYELQVSWITEEASGTILDKKDLDVEQYHLAQELLKEAPTGAKLIWTVGASRDGTKLQPQTFVSRLE